MAADASFATAGCSTNSPEDPDSDCDAPPSSSLLERGGGIASDAKRGEGVVFVCGTGTREITWAGLGFCDKDDYDAQWYCS